MIVYPTHKFKKSFMNMNVYYYDYEIEELKQNLDSFGLSYDLTIAPPLVSIIKLPPAVQDTELYDIRLKFNNEADEAFYNVIISEQLNDDIE